MHTTSAVTLIALKASITFLTVATFNGAVCALEPHYPTWVLYVNGLVFAAAIGDV